MCDGKGYVTIVDNLSDGGIHVYNNSCNNCKGFGYIDSMSRLRKIKDFFTKNVDL